MFRILCSITIAMILIAPAAHGQGVTSASQVARISITNDALAIHPGHAFHLVVQFRLSDHWHTYWRNPGASGAPTEFEVTAPEGFRVGKTRYPRPTAFTGPEGTTYGYERGAMFFIPVTAPADLGEGPFEFRVETTYLVCRGRCLLGQDEQMVQIQRAAPGGGTPPPLAAVTSAMARLPQPIKKLRGAQVTQDGEHLRITGTVPTGTDIAFFPDPGPGVTYGETVITIAGERFTIEIPLTIKPNNALGKPMYCAGLIALGRTTDPSYEFHFPLTPSDEGTQP